MKNYDVIIVGGGPTGVALGIELGFNNINTLILEKYHTPLLSPRAQLLNARSMEFFMRWQLEQAIKDKQILSSNFPNQSVWCSKLDGETYAIGNSNDFLNDLLSPQRNIRVPLWLTEAVLREKLAEFPCVDLLTQHEVIDIKFDDELATVRTNNESRCFKASYIVGCDGVNSITRYKSGINYQKLAQTKRVISIVFETDKFEKYITVTKGCLYFLLENPYPSAIGSINPACGLWYAQIIYEGNATTIDEIDIEQLLNEVSGIKFDKKILNAHFWNMQIQMAEHFSKKNRIFLVGDSAHGFVPTGAFGLNTGLGDVVNLGWKLSAVIRHEAKASILDTYEKERIPICMRNLKIAQQNADDMAALKKEYNPKLSAEIFAKKNLELAKQFSNSFGITLGYAYFDTPLIQLQENQSTLPMSKTIYHPTALPGFFLPHIWLDEGRSIYDILPVTKWTLLVSGESDRKIVLEWIKKLKSYRIEVDILNLKEKSYSSKYILIRPDWHIAFADEQLSNGFLKPIEDFLLVPN